MLPCSCACMRKESEGIFNNLLVQFCSSRHFISCCELSILQPDIIGKGVFSIMECLHIYVISSVLYKKG